MNMYITFVKSSTKGLNRITYHYSTLDIQMRDSPTTHRRHASQAKNHDSTKQHHQLQPQTYNHHRHPSLKAQPLHQPHNLILKTPKHQQPLRIPKETFDKQPLEGGSKFQEKQIPAKAVAIRTIAPGLSKDGIDWGGFVRSF